MKVSSKFLLLFLLTVLLKVGPPLLLLECRSVNNVTTISIDRFYYNNNNYDDCSLINQIIERHYAAISLSKCNNSNSNSNFKQRKAKRKAFKCRHKGCKSCIDNYNYNRPIFDINRIQNQNRNWNSNQNHHDDRSDR